MSIHSLERVMWRVRVRYPNKELISASELKSVIMAECGTSPQTYYNNKRALIFLKWIKTMKKHFRLTGEDLKGSYGEAEDLITEVPEKPNVTEDIDEPLPPQEEQLAYDEDGYDQNGNHISSKN